MKSRASQPQAGMKCTDSQGGIGFGSEIEGMLRDPTTRQSSGGAAVGSVANTLDDLMAELGMLRSDRREVPASPDRPPASRAGYRPGPRVSNGDAITSGSDVPLRPVTPLAPRTSTAAASPSTGAMTPAGAPPVAAGGSLLLPPAKGALPAVPGPGPVRAQSPMASRRSITGGPPGSPLPLSQPFPAPSPGVVERQALLESRIERMEAREHQLLSLIAQLQQQVGALTRAQQQQPPSQPQPQQSQQQQQPPPPQHHQILESPSSPVGPPSSTAAHLGGRQPSSNSQSGPTGAAAEGLPLGGESLPSPSPEAAIIAARSCSRDGDPAQQTQAGASAVAAAAATPGAGMQRPGTATNSAVSMVSGPVPPAMGAPSSSGRPNKLLGPQPSPAAEWEADASQLRKEMATLAAAVVRLREQLGSLVPGGPSPLSEELAEQAVGMTQLKQNLTQIAMDVVSLHKSLTAFKQNTERTHTTFEKALNDIQLQAQTNALNVLAAAPGGAGAVSSGPPNAVAAALAATGGVSGTLEESLRCAFAKPAMRSLPTFSNTPELGFMPDNSGAAAAAAAFGDMAGGSSAARKGPQAAAPAAAGAAGGLGAAWALLNSFEEQAAAEKEEQQKAAVIARQAMTIVDAKVQQVVLHVDRHMHMISADVEERLRMYEQTIIRMAQQIDRVQRVLRELQEQGPATSSRIVVRQGVKEVEVGDAGGAAEGGVLPSGGGAEGAKKEPAERPEEASLAGGVEAEGGVAADGANSTARENWVKAAAMATGRFVPQKEEEKKGAARSTQQHGYFRAPATKPAAP
ncbi:hypothetical protein Agub_g7867 [Astrephomene gubernaculifera]|uniref:Uncharacterized protein n=1 Tax=Astrephomene gubernaculifera TaxID=47775 RepID=A0AAD3DSI7_9CHLO|nr:hypothetical protein Agub_g7867 [Astrephomene gubernaculifera]